MAAIKIINGVSGSFPAQKATLVADKLAIRTNTGGQKTYPDEKRHRINHDSVGT